MHVVAVDDCHISEHFGEFATNLCVCSSDVKLHYDRVDIAICSKKVLLESFDKVLLQE